VRSIHLWLLSFAVACLIAASAAQQKTTMGSAIAGGQTTITVRVTYEQSHQPAAAMRVELIPASGGMADIRTTDGNGGATFTGVSGGRFKLRVTGPGIENTESDSFVAGGGEGGPYVAENVQVRLAQTTVGGAASPALAPIIPEPAQQEFKLGSKEMDKKNWREAKDHFQKAIAAFPKYSEAFNNLGQVDVQMHNGKDAVDAFLAATQIDPTLQQANLYLGQFYYENVKYKEAERYLLRAAADQPKSAQLLTALANTQLQNGETDLALANARKVPSLPNHKQFAICHLIVAQALSGKGQDDEIAKEYKEYLKEAPDSPLAPRVKDALAKLSSK
jgi:tetratricopeptide (TPR) repeat protein